MHDHTDFVTLWMAWTLERVSACTTSFLAHFRQRQPMHCHNPLKSQMTFHLLTLILTAGQVFPKWNDQNNINRMYEKRMMKNEILINQICKISVH